MKNTVVKLRQHYETRGNKFIFAGGFTLSELALKMWEHLDYQKIDAAILSRIINGERLFTPQQLEAFCQVLQLDKYEIHNMRMALFEDYYSKFGFELDLRMSPHFVNAIHNQIKQVKQVRISGHPLLSLEWSELLLSQINTLIESKPTSVSHNLYLLKADLLLRKIIVYRDILLPSKIIVSIMPLVQQIFAIAENNKDKRLIGQAYFSKGCAYHIAGKHTKAIENFRQALVFIKEPIILLRHLALSLAYLQRKKDFIHVQNQLLQKIQEANTNYSISEALEGLSRAQGLLKMPEAFGTWTEAKKLTYQMTKNGEKVFCRDIQLMRTYLEIVHAFAPTEKKYLNDEAKLMQRMAKEHGYQRHAKIIKKFLTK